MKMYFKISKTPIFNFDLDLKAKTITNIEVQDRIGFNVFTESFTNEKLTYEKFLGLFHIYMGGNEKKLDKYIDHILKHGFYTPYHPNVVINIVLTEEEKED